MHIDELTLSDLNNQILKMQETTFSRFITNTLLRIGIVKFYLLSICSFVFGTIILLSPSFGYGVDFVAIQFSDVQIITVVQFANMFSISLFLLGLLSLLFAFVLRILLKKRQIFESITNLFRNNVIE